MVYLQAEIAGVRVGDILVGINDEDFSQRATKLEELIVMIKSSPDEVTLYFQRPNPEYERSVDVSLMRAIVDFP